MNAFQFHPVIARWFERTYGSPTEPQERGWPAIRSGAHALIAAPTGSGKTLAAFLAALDSLFRAGLAGNLKDETQVVYVSPLKALSNDIHKNLEEPLAAIRAALLEAEGKNIELRAAVRTGDTPASRRQAMIRRPPHILVTTPESLYLLLTSVSGRKLLATARTLIVDEIHAVAASRRGSHLALSLERLAALTPHRLQRIGLSATQKPIELVARFLVGGARPDAELACAALTVAPAAGNGGANGQPAESCAAARGAQAEVGLARQLSGAASETDSVPNCAIIDCGYARNLDLDLEIPGSPLEAVMSHEVWGEVYRRLAELISEHRTTLVFVNTRRLAERVTHQLSSLLGANAVASHHGSLAARLRLEAEDRLKRGELRALVATASLELGIDIGSVDLVCQIGPTRSIATLLQRVGRARHQRGGLPKGRIFPLSRDELVECAAMLRSVRQGELDALEIPQKPLDVLAQQIVACAATDDWREDELFNLLRAAWPYRNLSRDEFAEVVAMLADGFTTKRGRRGALIHHDAVNQRIRARRGARLVALTSGGAIPDNADYRVLLEPAETFIGTVNEDFAVESLAGDIFQLGNASWRILRINAGTVRVEDAAGQPPNIPFWLGEAPGRTRELSLAVSDLRREIEKTIESELAPTLPNGRPLALVGLPGSGECPREAGHSVAMEPPEAADQAPPEFERAKGALLEFLKSRLRLHEPAALQLAKYFAEGYRMLGAVPTQQKLVLERFFDESGGMQLVIHSPFGIRLNRAWGLALRKRFCRSFNFELQAAASDEAIVISLGTQHSFPLAEVFRYLHSASVKDLLVQALLDAPMFPVRWRWNAGRALALPRQRGGRKIPAPLQRMESENLLAAVFPDQLACPENLVGDREIPAHPLVRQTIDDCLVEAMDINGLVELLRRIETGSVDCLARDLPEPSPFAHEIINARVYGFLDNAPLEERRTQAVYTRRANDSREGLGILEPAAIQKVGDEAWPRATSPDEVHEALLVAIALTTQELERTAPEAKAWLAELADAKRACEFKTSSEGPRFWAAAERLRLLIAIYPEPTLEPVIAAAGAERNWEREEAIRELLRGRLEISGPISARELSEMFRLSGPEIDAALLALEAQGVVLRGKFRPGATATEWCDRRLLARIHRLTINRLRAEIQPVSVADLQRFLLEWQRVSPGARAEGPDGLLAVLELLDGYEVPARAWEPDILAARVKDYSPQWLDQACFRGKAGWGRMSVPPSPANRPFAPVRSSPISIFIREHLPYWLRLAREPAQPQFSPDTGRVYEALLRRGALFFGELSGLKGLLPSRVEAALAELVAQGWATADSFEGLRALLTPPDKRIPSADAAHRRRHKGITSLELAGRWSLLRPAPGPEAVTQEHTQSSPNGRNHVGPLASAGDHGGAEGLPAQSSAAVGQEAAVEKFARALLCRYGIVFRRLVEREAIKVSWFELGRVYRRLEAQGEIRGGYFVSGVSGEQFALPEAVGLLRSIRKRPLAGEWVVISGGDPLNLAGILTPGPRVSALAANRILLRDGVPVAALEAGQVIRLDGPASELDRAAERALRVGNLSPVLRPYYA